MCASVSVVYLYMCMHAHTHIYTHTRACTYTQYSSLINRQVFCLIN